MYVKEIFNMKKMRLHIYIILGIFVVGFILGSIVDLQLSNAIFSRDNGFGLFMSAIGTLPGYMILAVLGGGFLSLGFSKSYKTAIRFIFFVLTVALLGCAIFFSGTKFFGPNGFTNEKIKWVGYFIVLPITVGCGYLGYVLVNKSETKYLWIVLGVMALFIFLALVPGATLLKSIFHRPRYRTLVLYDGIDFHNWWQRCSNYKALMEQYGIISEEFKSFPSVHAGAGTVFLLGVSALPLLDKKYERLQLPLFYGGLAWVLLVSFTRILVGAHFLSDVSMGGILTSVFMLANNEVLIALNKKYKLNPEIE